MTSNFLNTINPDDIFKCQNCGDCCQGYGGTYVTSEDIKAISAYIKEDPSEFIAKYCQISGNRPLLAQTSKGNCIFWNKICRIHPVKPRMCREWPFIKNVLADVTNWKIMANSCPGIRTDFPDKDIIACVQKELQKADNHMANT